MCKPYSVQWVLPREILAYGKLLDTATVYHGEFTTDDRDSGGSHLETLRKATKPSDVLSCSIDGCCEPAQVGAHVYFTSNEDAAADVCGIVATCKTHNNVNRVWRERGTFSQGGGVQDKRGAPFTVRKISPTAMAVKGARGKGGGKGQRSMAVRGAHGKGRGKGQRAMAVTIQDGLCDIISEFYYNEDEVETLVQSGILKNVSGT